ncbi:MAG: CDP-glucose 4,6-dehydratase [Ignavibacteriaceae bacterium]
MVDSNLFSNIYNGRRVLVTGHTGFKGSWLSLWLKLLGADVIGYSLEPPTRPNHFDLLKLEIDHNIGDILDESNLNLVFQNKKPEIVFHMAAQPLVRPSYSDPVLTYKTNIIGTLNILEACRKTSSVHTIINITTDKCYENHEWVWGYRETDHMGGYDPYSSSKACSELLTSSYRNSFFNDTNIKNQRVLLASVRAGNVIGGGDWALDRLIPDIIRAISQKKKVEIRNPGATRPWQHVLEPLSGYLLLASELIMGNVSFASGWNFGPRSEDVISVENVVKLVKNHWDELEFKIDNVEDPLHEAGYLKLDCSKANQLLNWYPVWENKQAISYTTEWYKNYYNKGIINSYKDIKAYFEDARKRQLGWAL